ncbi:thioredoxin-like protein [Dipodascopsis uninucleata]
MQVEVNPNEDTEWNDILRAHGIIPERPPSPSQVIEEAIENAKVNAENHRLSDKEDSELEELEDEEDSEFLAAYRRKRLLEMQDQTNARSKFGRVFPVSKPEYNSEVTEASKDCFVVVHLSLPTAPQSKLLAGLFTQAAAKYGEIKFVDIVGSRAIENYPDRNCPTILVYKDTDVKKQYVTLTLLGGSGMTLMDLERILTEVGAVKDNDSRLISVQREKRKQAAAANGDEYDYDEDDYDGGPKQKSISDDYDEDFFD